MSDQKSFFGLPLRDQVAAFHNAFGIPVVEKPTIPPTNRLQLRLRLIAEEFVELLAAAGCAVDDLYRVEAATADAIKTADSGACSMIGCVDAFADLKVVITGSELEFGVNGDAVTDEVMASNLSKVGSTIREDGKINKDAPGFFRPDIARVLRFQGWVDG